MEKVEKNEMRIQVRAMVDDLFSEKKESEIRKKTEIALEKSAETISNLTSALEEKTSEMADFEIKASESEESIQLLKKELEAAHEELEASKTSLETTEKVLEDMKKIKIASERMVELESAGVARAEKDSQIEKIKEMSDEEFTAYKEELVYVREAVEKELIKANKDLQTKKEEDANKSEEDKLKEAEELAKKEDEIKKAEEEAKKADGSNTNVGTEPAKITPGYAAMAAMNMEFVPDTNLMAKYAKLGEALAEKWKKDSKE